MWGSVEESIGLSPAPVPGQSRGTQSVPFLWPWQAQPTGGCPITLQSLWVVHRQVGTPATPETLVFAAHIRLTKLIVNAAPGETGQTDSFGETGTALLQEFTQWRHCAATALASVTKPGGNDHSEGATVRRNYVFALLSRLNLIFHAPKGTSSCSETFVAHSRGKLSSAIGFVFSKNTIFFRTS